MINRIYIDNYRCFTNFEWKPDSRVLIAGRNGSGKSSLLDVLRNLREFLTGQATTEALFPAHSITAWDPRNKQVLELDVTCGQALYEYRLEVEHDAARLRSRIAYEKLAMQGMLLYEYKEGEAHLFRDNGSLGPVVSVDWTRSFIPTISERSDNQYLVGFRGRMERIYIFKPDPTRMSAVTRGEDVTPEPSLGNLSSWLRHLQIEDSEFSSRLRDWLKPILPGFVSYGLKSDAEGERTLLFHFGGDENGARAYKLTFDRLSDGQRVLSALYIVLEAAMKPDTTLCIDEPDNFVALREVQPWLLELQERQEDTGAQCLLVSHHPELINYLTPMGETVLFTRDGAGPVRTRPFDWSGPDEVSASAVFARGWESNE